MRKKIFINKIACFFASGFFLGYFPVIPGTIASLFIYLALFFLPQSSFSIQIIFLSLLFFIGISVVSHVLKIVPDKDPSWVVIDEFCGMGIALLALPQTFVAYSIAFLLFRLFDISKIFPVNYAERACGAWGVMADDVVAGILALTGAHVFCYFFY